MNQQTDAAGNAAHIAVLLPSLDGGGAERSMLNLIGGFIARGRKVDLLLCRAKGPLMKAVPAGTNVIELQASNGLNARLLAAYVSRRQLGSVLRPVVLAKKNAPEIARVSSLGRYLEREQPDVLLSALTYANVAALLAKRLVASPVPVVVSERNALATWCNAPHKHRKWRFRYLPEVVRKSYPAADAVVTVSEHVAHELRAGIGLLHPRIDTLYNPVVDDELLGNATAELDHPWFAPGEPPVVLAVGRLTEQKDFPTLLRAFAKLRAAQPARLVILGEGRLRDELSALAIQLGIADDLAMPGFVDNPFPYMSRAAVLALSSAYEGLPGVLIQAMACGCPVVSTNCPGGSAEILSSAAFGPLVEVGNPEALAVAIAAQIEHPTSREKLQQRAADFSVDNAVSKYLFLLDELSKN